MVSNSRHAGSGPVILRTITKAQAAREDATALILAKMVSIAENKDRAYFQLVDEVSTTKERARNVIHAYIGIIVQYAEGAGGFLALCEHLVKRLQERQIEGSLPIMGEKWHG